MHPAPSIIVFTTLSGPGYGLAAVLGLGLLDASAFSTQIAHVVALTLIGVGLSSSALHLGIRKGRGGLLRSGGRVGCRVRACWRR